MLYQYNNIYISLHKIFKRKTHTHTHKTDYWKKKNVAIVATVPLGTVVIVQNLGEKKWLMKPQNIYFELWLVTVSYFIILF